METNANKKAGKTSRSRKSGTVKMYHQFDPNYDYTRGESIQEGESLTTPNMHITIKKLLINHTRNIPSQVNENKGEFFEDLVIPRFDDMLDAQEWVEDIIAKKGDMDKEMTEAIKAAAEAQIESKVQERLEKQQAEQKAAEEEKVP